MTNDTQRRRSSTSKLWRVLSCLLLVGMLHASTSFAQGPMPSRVALPTTLTGFATSRASLHRGQTPALGFAGRAQANVPESAHAEQAFGRVHLSTDQSGQGRTIEVSVRLKHPGQVSGVFRDQKLHFAQDENGVWWALLAIGMPRAQAGVGLPTPGGAYTLELANVSDDGVTIGVERLIQVIEGQYTPGYFDLGPDKRWLLDAKLRASEAERLQAMFNQGAAEPLWQGRFSAPIAARVTGGFNIPRIFPDGSTNYHEGLDYSAAMGTPIRAAAHGVVTLAEPLDVRGNAVYINHGMGVFSGYFHMSQILVTVGQEVKQGQVIGRVGTTGMSTGPHLHFEIRLNGYNVSPLEWLQESFP